MATSINLGEWSERVRLQFSQLDRNDPSLWPTWPKRLLLAGVVVFVGVMLWFLWLSPVVDSLTQEREKEVRLREEFRIKQGKAINLEVLKSQLEQVKKYVETLEKQLPDKAEMDALLSDINQAGLGRGLAFDLFRPGAVKLSDFYAEQPIEIKVTGSFHNMGEFAADVAALSRIVTLNNISLTPGKDKEGLLVMESVAKTFRYLDAQEQEQVKELARKKEKEGGKK